MEQRVRAWLAVAVLLMSALAACSGNGTGNGGDDVATGLKPAALAAGERLSVVATTNIVGDVVSRVGGGRIDLLTLMEPGVDPHSYVPTPSDSAAIHDGHVVFANGAGLEVSLERTLSAAGGDAIVIHLSEGLDLLPAAGEHEEEEGDHDHGDLDPHVWFSIPNVITWAGTVEQVLSTLDPANAEHYQASAEAYRQELQALDEWVFDQVALIPEENRKLVTNHPAFGYLAQRYGLEQVGALYPVNPAAEPSARDIADIEDTIRAFDVPAVFTESTVNPRLAQQVADDTGVRLVSLYTGSLGEPGSGVESYVEMMRYDVNAIVEALR
ncbi:MAG: zinc ABC transporter substrate-binding protein [Anaerolineae bacterium]|nr:zinc ABC transporter substrate-binding protein [Anaerolineae bacterium]